MIGIVVGESYLAFLAGSVVGYLFASRVVYTFDFLVPKGYWGREAACLRYLLPETSMPGEVLAILRMTSRVEQRPSLGDWETSPKCPVPFPGLKDQLCEGGG